MKKYYLLALVAILALAGCDNKNNEPANQAPTADAPVFTATIEGNDNAANGPHRTAIVDGSADNKKKVEWLNNDKVFVFSIKASYEPVVIGEYSAAPNSTDATKATLNPGADLIDSRGGNSALTLAYYPASISWMGAPENRSTVESYIANNRYAELASMKALLITLPAQQTNDGNDLSRVAPMAARCESGNTLRFCNITALLAVSVPSTMFSSVQKITVSADKPLWGDFSLNETSGSNWNQLIAKSSADANRTVTLVCNASGANTAIPDEGTKTFYVSIPPETYGSLRITVTDGTTTQSISTQAQSITVERNKVYPIGFTQEKTNLLAGVYSVSATKTVHFTCGNLYWNGTEYKLEEHQSDCPTTWKPQHVGHFYWYTAANVSAGNLPYAATWNSHEATATDGFFCGENHKMTVEGTTDLYALSQAEWEYLINGRSQTNRFAKARVNGKAGLLLFPDGYVAPLPATGMTTVNDPGTVGTPLEYPTVDIPADTWAVMEAMGVVFLPAAGYRTDTNITLYPEDYPNDKTGLYWSSTPYSSEYEAAQSISYALYSSTKNVLLQIITKGFGNSIRLVK